MKKVTVIIPCYNGYQFMGNCLRALEEQTYKDFSVIVIDDCSTDNSLQELLLYKETTNLDMIIIHNEKNMKLALSRKIGVENSNSEWICFCDCDDWYEIDFLEKMMGKAESINADAVMCHFNYAYDDGSKKYLKGLNILSDDSSKEEFIAFTPMSLCRFLFKKTLYENLVVPQINNAEDGAVTPQILAKSNKTAIIHEGLYNYYIRENSLSNVPKQTIYFDFLKAQQVVDATIGKEYPEESEFIGIKNYCYGAILSGLKAKVSRTILKKDYKDFMDNHPAWYKNKYIISLSMKRRIFLFFLKHKMFFALKVFSKLHQKFSK